MKCFYHNDLDGKAAAFCVYAWVGINDNYRPNLGGDYPDNFIEIDYRDRLPIESIRPNEQIWIVDFSIKPEEMVELLKITNNVTWIDHHKTAIEKYSDFPHEINGVRRDGEAGCVLTWKYIHWYSDRVYPFPISTWGDRERELSVEIPVPRMIELVGDRDIWAWKYGKETKDFTAGSQLYDTNPSSDFWWKCMEHELKLLPHTGNAAAKKRGKVFWNRVLSEGDTINRYMDASDEALNEWMGYETTFNGLNCWAINRGRVSSASLGGRTGKYDAVMTYFHDGNNFTVTIYSEKVDASEIAKGMGGGGHRGAAGFVCKELPFCKK